MAKKQTSQSIGVVFRAGSLQSSAPEQVCAQVERLLLQPAVYALWLTRLCRFLRFSVQQALGGNLSLLKEQVIGVEVFDRKPDYDPRIDPIVRVEARRLRAKLKAYYTSTGRADPIVIGLPKGAYLPLFKVSPRDSAQKPAAPTTSLPVASAKKSIVILRFHEPLTQSTGDDYF